MTELRRPRSPMRRRASVSLVLLFLYWSDCTAFSLSSDRWAAARPLAFHSLSLFANNSFRGKHRLTPCYESIHSSNHHNGKSQKGRTYRSRLTILNGNKDTDDVAQIKNSFLQRAAKKFRDRPVTYLLIPCVAALVGWFTNWLAVQMIFYPIQFAGIPIYRRPEIPLGLLGWQGIIPCKTKPMTEVMVNM
jgi:hypothetical protein